ncbi:NLI interacting factor-like phosphatase, partial [Opisthorchis viverrini]
YADPVCDFIDESSHFRHRLFREACVYHQNNLIKDLSRLGRDVDQVCIVDNSAVSFLFQPNNALHIVSWFDDPNDQALLGLIPYLRGLAKSDTVVDYLRQFQPPPSAVVAHPPTPSCLLLFNTAYSNDSEDNEGSDHLDEI